MYSTRTIFPRVLLTAIFALCFGGNASAEKLDTNEPKEQIEQVLAEQAKAWNAGDVERFMEGYAKTPELRFASGNMVTRGWQETLDHYKQRYPDHAAMGVLTFSQLETTVFSRDAAVVFGRWRLKTEKSEPNGLFTLIFRRTEMGWRIVADHTSAAPSLD